jgi:hypothetical protein
MSLALLGAQSARAVDPFEIQVYEGDINEPLQPGLEVHTNFVASGRQTPAFAGEEVPHGSWRTTLEPSIGLLEWWELGAYLQFMTAPSRSEAHFGGFKLRSKFVVPRRTGDVFTLGLNIEVGRGVTVLGSAQWDTEFRPIIAFGHGRWFAAFNPILGWALSGELNAVPDFEPSGKVRFDTGFGFALGAEYYAGLGHLDDIPGWEGQEHFVYAVLDLLEAPFDLNAGVGHGLTGASDDWILKAIVGLAF